MLHRHITEHADHFRSVTGQGADVQAVLAQALVRGHAVPLHHIVLRGIPQERVAHRCIRRVGGLSDGAIELRHPVENMPHCIDAAGAILQVGSVE
ncbi:hypothetical protein D3C76_1004930 [compost metagenome]